MTVQATSASVLRDFCARASTIITDFEDADISSDDATPARTDSEGNALKPFGIHCDVGGAVKFTTLAGTTTTRVLPAGTHPIAVTKIFKVGTAATGLAFVYGTRKD